jgi:uncharacterized protein (DUF433 family)
LVKAILLRWLMDVILLWNESGGDPMQLEDYFEFLAPDDIRVKGTRVGIETILTDYLELGLFAEQIAVRYPTLSVEQVYATLTYYWRNRTVVDTYLRTIDREIEGQRREQDLHPSPAVQRLRELARRRDQQRAQVAAPA